MAILTQRKLPQQFPKTTNRANMQQIYYTEMTTKGTPNKRSRDYINAGLFSMYRPLNLKDNQKRTKWRKKWRKKSEAVSE